MPIKTTNQKIGIGGNRQPARVSLTNLHYGHYYSVRLDVYHVELLQFLAYTNFLTFDQLDMIYQLIHPTQKHLSKSTIRRWSDPKYGVLQSINPTRHRTYYTLSKMAAQELMRQKFLDSQDVANRSYNEHNMLLNQAIVNALYQTHTSLLQDNNYRQLKPYVENGFALLAIARNWQDNKIPQQIVSYWQQCKRHRSLADITVQNNQLPVWFYGLDLRSYNRQLNIDYEKTKNLTLKPDGLIRFGNHLIYLELDNLTETNQRLDDKIIAYMRHAARYPHEQIDLCMIFNDGSMRNQRVANPHRPSHKISQVVSDMLNIRLRDNKNNNLIFMYRYYDKLSNLNIYLSPLVDCWVDISDIFQRVDLNYRDQRTETEWENQIAHYNPDKKLRLYCTEHQITSRYNSHSYLGNFRWEKDGKVSPKLSIIYGQEHLVDTMISAYLSWISFKQNGTPCPFIIYPFRNEHVDANLVDRMIIARHNTGRKYNYQVCGLLQITQNYDLTVPTIRITDSDIFTKQSVKEL